LQFIFYTLFIYCQGNRAIHKQQNRKTFPDQRKFWLFIQRLPQKGRSKNDNDYGALPDFIRQNEEVKPTFETPHRLYSQIKGVPCQTEPTTKFPLRAKLTRVHSISSAWVKVAPDYNSSVASPNCGKPDPESETGPDHQRAPELARVIPPVL
jgi:hypothetical protein